MATLLLPSLSLSLSLSHMLDILLKIYKKILLFELNFYVIQKYP